MDQGHPCQPYAHQHDGATRLRQRSERGEHSAMAAARQPARRRAGQPRRRSRADGCHGHVRASRARRLESPPCPRGQGPARPAHRYAQHRVVAAAMSRSSLGTCRSARGADAGVALPQRCSQENVGTKSVQPASSRPAMMVGAPPATQPNDRREACTHRGRPESPSVCAAAYTSRMATLMECSQRLGLVGPDAVTCAYWASVGEGSRPSSSQIENDSSSNGRRLARGSPGHGLQCGVTLRRRRA